MAAKLFGLEDAEVVKLDVTLLESLPHLLEGGVKVFDAERLNFFDFCCHRKETKRKASAGQHFSHKRLLLFYAFELLGLE